MMNKVMFFLFYWGVSLMVNANENIEIRTKFSMKNIFCIIEHNDVIGFENRSSAALGRGFGNGSINSLLVLKNGENTVKITVASLGWFKSDISEITGDNEKFSNESKCTLDIIRVNSFSKEKNIITKMEVKINERGIPEVYFNGKLDVTVEPKIKNIQAPNKILKNKIYDIDYTEFPVKMVTFEFSQSFFLEGIPKWNWTYAESFKSSNEELNKLKKAYLNRWELFNKKDLKGIEKLMSPALINWSIATNSSTKNIFNSYEFNSIFNSKNYNMQPIDWDNFRVQVMNDGKLVRMVYKEDISFSPLTMSYLDEDGDEAVESFSPYFSLINNEWVEVL